MWPRKSILKKAIKPPATQGLKKPTNQFNKQKSPTTQLFFPLGLYKMKITFWPAFIHPVLSCIFELNSRAPPCHSWSHNYSSLNHYLQLSLPPSTGIFLQNKYQLSWSKTELFSSWCSVGSSNLSDFWKENSNCICYFLTAARARCTEISWYTTCS